MLGMVGTDHMPPVRDLPASIPSDARVATLTDYFAAIDGETPPVGWHGELRSASRANLLPNVVSARIDIKQACARAERALERYAEPLQALYGDEWPEPFLRIAWSRLLQNSAHDSICGCSTDEVSAQVLVRYAEAEQIGTELALRAVQRIAADTPSDCVVVVNPSPFRRSEVVDLPDGALAVVEAPPLGWTTVQVPAPKQGAGTFVSELDLSTLRIVDGGDYGDSYTYAPPATDRLVDEPLERSTEVVENEPLRRRVLERRVYEWPRGLDGTRRSDKLERVEVTLTAETRAGEGFVRIRIELENPCDDHRVRVHVPLREPTGTTRAEGQFAIVERARLQEAGFGEDGLGAYPASSFVSAGGIALLFEHVSEYELVGDRELAVTALRSTGLISRTNNPYRPVDAGPEVAIPDAQMRKRHVFSFAWCPDVDNALVHAEAFRHPFLVAPGGTGDKREQSGPEFPGLVLSSLRRRGGKLVARVANESDTAVGDLRPWEIRELSM
jgi:Alpha mannosidase middle domain